MTKRQQRWTRRDIESERAGARGGRMTRTNSSRTIKTNDPVASTSSSLGLSPRPGLTAGWRARSGQMKIRRSAFRPPPSIFVRRTNWQANLIVSSGINFGIVLLRKVSTLFSQCQLQKTIVRTLLHQFLEFFVCFGKRSND